MYARVSVSTLCRLALVTHNTHTHSVPQEVNHHTPSSVSWGSGKAGTVWIRPAFVLSLRPRPGSCVHDVL